MDNVTLGQTIGVVKHNLDITLDNGTKANAQVHIDFTNVTDTDIKSWLSSNRVISGQRAWRKMSLDEFTNDVDGQTFQAGTIGQKVKTRAEKLAVYTSMGLPPDLANIAVDDPVKFQNIMDKANIGNDTIVEDAEFDVGDSLKSK